jgi:peptidoglycan/LPS O-acetylase OafA/YrhL
LKTFADLSAGRDNHFNLIRLLAASAVLVSHSFPLTMGMKSVEPLEHLTGQSLGAASVYIFFGISGYMITRSFDRRTDLWSFAAARIARIFPGLLVVLVLTAFLLGPIVASVDLRTFFSDSSVWSYIPRNLSLRFLQYELPYVFSTNIYPEAINGSLWTLFWEVACYIMVVALGLAGGLRGRWFGMFLLLYTAFAAYMTITGQSGSWTRLSIPFVAGMAIYVFRAKVPAGWLPLLLMVAGTLACYDTAIWPLLYGALLAYISLWLGHAKAAWLLGYNRLGDYSYGTYIYAFPVQQTAAWAFPGLTVLQMILIALPVTWVLAVLSWHLVESPALERRERLAGLIRMMLPARLLQTG